MTPDRQPADREQIRAAVAARYAGLARAARAGETVTDCDPGEFAAGGFGAAGYPDASGLPGGAVRASLGWGNPVAVADLREGERVLDLGSGGGIDVLLSARRVGPSGFAYGVDMTDDMLEPLAGMLRPGSAGSNTAADHLAVLDAAITALPPGFRRRLMVTCDGAGASHDLIARLDKLAARPGYQLTYSVGWELGARERAGIGAVPAAAWQIAVDARGEIRERRAEQACGKLDCGHRRCWIEEAHVTELTPLLREGPAGDQLAGWPGKMRVFARRERPHPGAQLTLFEAEDGWRYSLWVTNRPASTRGWLGHNAYLDAAHRVHARVEDASAKTAASASTRAPRWR